MSAILKVYVLCDVAMTSTPNVLTTELRDLLHNLCINVLLFVFYLSYGWIRVCKNRFVSTGENRGKPRLVCKKRFVSTGENRGKPCLVCKKYPIGCWIVTLVTECSIRTSQPLKILIIKLHTKMCNVRTYLHTNMRYFCPCLCTYENVIWPNLCYTQKYDILYLQFFYIWKYVMSISGLLVFQNLDSGISNCFKRLKRESQFHSFFRFGPLHSLYWW